MTTQCPHTHTPNCEHTHTRVTNSRYAGHRNSSGKLEYKEEPYGVIIHRTRKCKACGAKLHTIEMHKEEVDAMWERLSTLSPETAECRVLVAITQYLAQVRGRDDEP